MLRVQQCICTLKSMSQPCLSAAMSVHPCEQHFAPWHTKQGPWKGLSCLGAGITLAGIQHLIGKHSSRALSFLSGWVKKASPLHSHGPVSVGQGKGMLCSEQEAAEGAPISLTDSNYHSPHCGYSLQTGAGCARLNRFLHLNIL